MLRRTLAMLAVLAAGVAVADDKKPDAPSLEGTWKIVSGVKDGDKIPADKLGEDFVVTKTEMTLKTPDATFKFDYKIDAKTTPVALDMTMTEPEGFKGTKAKGIVEVTGKTAKLCYHAMGGDRPKGFESKSGSGEFGFVMEKK